MKGAASGRLKSTHISNWPISSTIQRYDWPLVSNSYDTDLRRLPRPFSTTALLQMLSQLDAPKLLRYLTPVEL